MADPATLQDCLDWYRRYPISVRTCLDQFHEFTSFQLGFICSLAAAPFGRGSRGAPFTNRQKIAQAAWVLIVIALFIGLMRRRAFRYSQQSTSQIVWEPLAFCSKLLAIAFAPLFGILVGDLDPNSNLLEVLVWILPGLLFHRYSPEIIEENSLTGMLINTVTYIPGLLTACFSIWSAGDFSLLAPEEVWGNSKHYLHQHWASLAVRVLASVTIGVAFLRQTFGAYTNLVLATKRQVIDYKLGEVNERLMGRNNRVERQEQHDRIMQSLYETNGLPRLGVDLDRHSLKNHIVLVVAEVLTFVPLGLFVIWTTTLVKGLSFCTHQSPSVPSFFSLQALACRPRDFSCQKVSEIDDAGATLLDTRFCDSPSFNIALFTGYLAVVFTLASFFWLFVQVWAVYKNHSNSRRPACTERSPQAIRDEFSHQVKHLLGTYYSRTGVGAYFLLPFLVISIWRQPRSFRTTVEGPAENAAAENTGAAQEWGIVDGHRDVDEATVLEVEEPAEIKENLAVALELGMVDGHPVDVRAPLEEEQQVELEERV